MQPSDERTWVSSSEHARAVLAWGNWRRVALAIFAVAIVGAITTCFMLTRLILAPSDGAFAVTVPRDCRVGDDSGDLRLYLTVEVAALFDGSLSSVSTFGGDQGVVESAVVVPVLAALAELTDEEIERIARGVDEATRFEGSGFRDGVLLVVIRPVDQRAEGRVDGINLTWVLGEPAIRQSVPLGIQYEGGHCTVPLSRP